MTVSLYRTFKATITIQYNSCFNVGLHRGLMGHGGDLKSVGERQ